MTDTRQQILQHNYRAVRLHGFQGARADKVVQEMGVTKGALYYYFPNKQSLGYAIVDEIIGPFYISSWTPPAGFDGNPIDRMLETLDHIENCTLEDEIKLGCPLSTLMQEMSPLDEGFRLRFERILLTMRQAIGGELQRGVSAGMVRPLDADQTAWFILSNVFGAFNVAKSMQDVQVFRDCFAQLRFYLNQLRA